MSSDRCQNGKIFANRRKGDLILDLIKQVKQVSPGRDGRESAG